MKTAIKSKTGLVPKRPEDLQPAAINNKVYRPVSPDDPAIQALAESVEAEGILQPLHVTTDGVILSGHRRHCAALIAGLETVPTIVEPITSTDDSFTALLVKHNQQREKSFDEVLRESAVIGAADERPEVALRVFREESAEITTAGSIINGGKFKGRSEISEAKHPFVMAIVRVLNDQQEFWPLSVRQIHYQLLNDPPLTHSSKPNSTYKNRQNFYKQLVDLCLRLRLVGLIPWHAIHDPTRPVSIWKASRSATDFLREQQEQFLRGYRRDLMQSQPCHIEIVGEKNTIATIIENVAWEYCIPVTIGRGYCSGPPRKQIVERFEASGKERLLLLVLSDHDPDGNEIAESLERSFRGDFGVQPERLTAIRAALTAEQVDELGLPASSEKAKRTSSNYASFVQRFGDDVYELEAVDPKDLQSMLRQEIESVLDWDAFQHEQDQQEEDIDRIAQARAAVRKALEAISLEGGED